MSTKQWYEIFFFDRMKIINVFPILPKNMKNLNNLKLFLLLTLYDKE